jgi:hypothetical protein
MYRLELKATGLDEAVRLVTELMEEVTLAAKVIAAAGMYATGDLADSIDMDGPRIEGGLVVGSVGSDLPYAQVVHDGAGRHHIFPKSAKGVWRFGERTRPQLKFYWRRLGRVVYFPHIPASYNTLGYSHPGLKGKQYLARPLRAIGRAKGFKVNTVQL